MTWRPFLRSAGRAPSIPSPHGWPHTHRVSCPRGCLAKVRSRGSLLKPGIPPPALYASEGWLLLSCLSHGRIFVFNIGRFFFPDGCCFGWMLALELPFPFGKPAYSQTEEQLVVGPNHMLPLHKPARVGGCLHRDAGLSSC